MIIIEKPRNEIILLKKELEEHSAVIRDFQILTYRDWYRYKESYLISRESIILLINLEDKQTYRCAVKIAQSYYPILYIVKNELKDYCLSYLKQGIMKIYESI